MYRYYEEQKLRDEEKIAYREMELKSLKSQLDNHFLFNATNTVYSYTKEEPQVASKLLEHFSGTLRHQLENTIGEKVLLKDEISFIQDYMMLQMHRFTEHTAIDFQIVGEPGDLKVYPLLMIPFIENAFKHGNLGEKTAFIHVLIHIDENHLFFEVKNSLPSMPEEVESMEIGQKNILKLLEILYPSHKLHMKHRKEEFTVNLELTLNE